MKAYRASGSFSYGKNSQEFSLDIVAADEDDAWHRIYSNFGSRHGVPRRFIKVDSLMEIDPSDSTAPVVVAHFRDDWATHGVQVWNHHPHFWGVGIHRLHPTEEIEFQAKLSQYIDTSLIIHRQ